MSNIAEKINKTFHNDFCVNCGEICCKEYYGDVRSSVNMLIEADKDPSFHKKLFNHLVKRAIYANNLSKEDSELSIKTSMEYAAYFLFHIDIRKLDHDFREKAKKDNARCLFYDNGCVIYQARPNMCKEHVCPSLKHFYEKEIQNSRRLF